MSAPADLPLDRALVRFNARVLGAALAVLAGSGLFVATVVLWLEGGDPVGTMLGQLRFFFPGYSVSLGGAFVGAAWAAAGGYAVGALFARLYGPWLLREAGREVDVPGGPSEGVIRLPAVPVGLVAGAIAALGLVLATTWLSLAWGEPSPHLQLLDRYLPGYAADPAGALRGAPFAFAWAALAAGAVAALYNRLLALRSRRGPHAR